MSKARHQDTTGDTKIKYVGRRHSRPLADNRQGQPSRTAVKDSRYGNAHTETTGMLSLKRPWHVKRRPSTKTETSGTVLSWTKHDMSGMEPQASVYTRGVELTGILCIHLVQAHTIQADPPPSRDKLRATPYAEEPLNLPSG